MFRISRLGIVLFVSLIACNLSKAQNTTKDLINLSIKYLEQNDSTAFRKTYQDIFMQYVTEALCAPFDKAIQDRDQTYIQAQLDSLTSDPEEDAFTYHLLSKPEYQAFYYTLPRWEVYKSWIDSVKRNPHADMRNEIWQIQREDQGIRILWLRLPNETGDNIRKKVRDEILLVDRQNTERAIHIIDTFGEWPGTNRLGCSADQTLWLCIQHADQRPEVATRYLPMLQKAVEEKRTDPMHYAYLVDRIRMHECKEQIYGTQTYHVKEENGNKFFFVIPIEDIDHVDERRAGIGMDSLSDYVNSMGYDWDIRQYKKDLPKIWKYYRHSCEKKKN